MGTARERFTMGVGTLLAFTPLGLWGYTVAGLLAGAVFEPDIPKSSIEPFRRLMMNVAESGIPIPLLYGTQKIGGNAIYRGKLERQPYKVSVDTGGKGGGGGGSKKVKGGYYYFMNAAMGLCEGVAEVSRMWADKDILRHLGTGHVTVYRGTADQNIDPLINSKVNNPVPFRNLSYVVFDSYSLGKDNNRAPLVTAETHHYPFNADAGEYNRVYNYYKDRVDIHGIMLKTNKQKVVTVRTEEIKQYSRTMGSLEKTISLSDFGIGTLPRAFDAVLLETRKGGKNVYFIHSSPSGYKLKMGRTDLSGSAAVISHPIFGPPAQPDEWTLFDDHMNYARITDNDRNVYILFVDSSTYQIWKQSLSSPQNNIAKYTISSDFSTPPTDIAVNGDYIFVCGDDKLICYTLSGVKVDTLDPFLGVRIDTMWGGKDIIGHFRWEEDLGGGDWAVHERFYQVTYDENGTLRLSNAGLSEEFSGTPYWRTNDSPDMDGTDAPLYYDLYFAKDATLFMSVGNYDDSSGGVQYIHIDANPAHVMYDAIVEVRKVPVAKLNLPSLQDTCDYCFVNQVGVSLLQNTEIKLRDFLKRMMAYVQGMLFVNNEGKYTFKTFSNTDPVLDDLTEESFVAGDYELLNVTLKDRAYMANRVTVAYVDRMHNYRLGSFEADHFLAQERDGEVVSQSINYLWISLARSASIQGYRLLKYAQYDSFVFVGSLMPKYLKYELGDVVSVTLPDMDFDTQKIRIMTLGEPDLARGGALNFVARIEEDYLNNFDHYNISQSEAEDLEDDMPISVRPIMWEQPALQNNDVYVVCLTAMKLDEASAGCDVYYSEDDIDYQYMGSLNNLAVAGVVNEDIGVDDKTIELDVTDYPDPFYDFTVEEQRNNRSFSLIGVPDDDNTGLTNLEFISFREVDQVGDIVTLSNCYRGKDYTLPRTHDKDDELLLLVGTDRFIHLEFPQTMVGKTIYIKAVGINYNGDQQDFDEVVVYEYLIRGLTRKATHVSGLEIEEGGEGQGSLITTQNNDVKVRWKLTARIGGIDRVSISAWLWDDFVEGDVTGYDALIYNTGMTLIATHEVTDGLTNLYYIYEQSVNTADFGGFTKNFFIGIRPKNANGYVDDVVLQEIVINT